MASRAQTNAKAKEKKQKIIAAGGGVLLLALLAYQGPKLMKHGQHAPVPQSGSPSAAATPTSATPGATAAPSGTPQLAASTTKLASFTFFSSKDPFVPRVSDKTDSSAAPSTPTPAATAPPAASTSTPSGSGPMFGTVDGPATATPSPTTTGKTTPQTSKLPGATLKLNGTKIRVQLGQAFPKNQPIFRLAGIKKGSVRIALVKGGLADGTSAVTLAKRHPLTLVNTADNKRWTIVLLSANKGT